MGDVARPHGNGGGAVTADLRPTVLPSIEDVRAMSAFDAWRLAEGLRNDLSVHVDDFWTCTACSLIRAIERRDQ